MLLKFSKWNSDFVEVEIGGISVSQEILPLNFDGIFEGINGLVSGNFDPKNELISIS
jgi:hypothetical protein